MKIRIEDLKHGQNYSRPEGLGDLTGLRESMRQNGLIVPVIVAQDGVTLIAGFRRTEAARQLGWEEIEAVATQADPKVANLIENLIREDLSLWDEMVAIRDVFGTDASYADVQRALGKSKSWVKPRVDAWQLPQEKIDEIRAGRIDIGRLRSILKEKSGPTSYQRNTGRPSATEISQTVTELLRRGKQAEARALSYALGTLSRADLLS